MMRVLTMYSGGHDSNACYYDGTTVSYFKAERHFAKKHLKLDPYMMFDVVQRFFGFQWDDIDAVFVDSTFLNGKYFGSLYTNDDMASLETYFKMDSDREDNPYNRYCRNIFVVGHHFAHHFQWCTLLEEEPDVTVVIDGFGDYRSSSIIRKNNIVESVPHKFCSIGHLCERIAAQCGIHAECAEDLAGKLMSWVSQGKVVPEFLEVLREKYPSAYQPYYPSYGADYDLKEPLTDVDLMIASEISQHAAFGSPDWGATIYQRMSEMVHEIFDSNCDPSETIFYTGGVALNVTWNTELRKKYPNLIIPPMPGDEGLSIGMMNAASFIMGFDTPMLENFPYSQFDVSPKSTPSDKTINETAEFLASTADLETECPLIAWYQGNGEIGPRALGNRSLLMNPMNPLGKKYINHVKNREDWRPFGATVLEEFAEDWFDIDGPDKYMLFTAKPKKDMPAITHIDGTCRVQTLSEEDNPSFYKLLKKFYELTGCPVLLNTSLNAGGMPIMAYTAQAKDYLSTTGGVHGLVIGDNIYRIM